MFASFIRILTAKQYFFTDVDGLELEFESNPQCDMDPAENILNILPSSPSQTIQVKWSPWNAIPWQCNVNDPVN
jgi:hypothetical protein